MVGDGITKLIAGEVLLRTSAEVQELADIVLFLVGIPDQSQR